MQSVLFDVEEEIFKDRATKQRCRGLLTVEKYTKVKVPICAWHHKQLNQDGISAKMEGGGLHPYGGLHRAQMFVDGMMQHILLRETLIHFISIFEDLQTHAKKKSHRMPAMHAIWSWLRIRLVV